MAGESELQVMCRKLSIVTTMKQVVKELVIW